MVEQFNNYEDLYTKACFEVMREYISSQGCNILSAQLDDKSEHKNIHLYVQTGQRD